MSVHLRTWTTAKGEVKEAWTANYTDQLGKRRMKTFARKKDADAFHDRTKVDFRAGVHTPDSSSMTVAQAAEKWIRTCRDAGLERSTIESYEQNVKLHIEPFLGRMKLSQLSAPGVREFQDDLRSGKPAPGEDQGKERSPMVKKILNSLGSIIGDAQERGLVARNVVRNLRSRRKRGNAGERRAKSHLKAGVDIPNREEIGAFVRSLQGRWRPILLTTVFTGLRASELRGLRWADVDLNRRELHVRTRTARPNIPVCTRSGTSTRRGASTGGRMAGWSCRSRRCSLASATRRWR